MSRNIDKYVASMEFDNKQFEAGVKTSLSTLDKLKRSLKLTEASKGLENVSSAAKKFDMSPMCNAAEKVGLKFSAMYTVADQALRNLVNSAEMYSKRIISAFTIDPIKSGFQEYETQINAIQTILSNTESKGTTLDDVNAALDELNKYADKTIYNFTEMTRNIGTFTAAGTDLETSVNAIQGIANLAAISGSTSQQASTAMYQLSQALASGTVKLMDWNSVVNAGMGGQVFQDALKETARVHGIAIDDMIKKNGSFRETLQEGWLTSEILTETLMKFTMTTEGLTDAQIEQNRAMLKSIGYTDEQIEGIFKLGKNATDAATKVKTFTQLMDTLKEAAQSGWTQTWELLVGDFGEAKELFTYLSDTFSGIIGKSADSRNKMLGGALTSNWDKLITKVNEAGVSTEKFEETLKGALNEHGYNAEALIKNYGSLEEVFHSGAAKSEVLNTAIGKLNGTVDKNGKTLKKAVEYTVKEGDNLWSIARKYNLTWYDIYKLNKDIIKNPELIFPGQVLKIGTEAMEESTEATGKQIESYEDLINSIQKTGGRELLVESLKNVLESIIGVCGNVSEAWRDVFPPMTSDQLYSIIEKIHKFTEGLEITDERAEKIKRTFKGLFSVLGIVKTVIGAGATVAFNLLKGVLSGLDLDILDITAALGDAITNFHKWLTEDNKVVKFFSDMSVGLGEGVKKIYDWIKAFVELPDTQEKLKKFKEEFDKLKDSIKGKFEGADKPFKDFIDRIKALDGLTLDNIGKALTDFWDNIVGYFTKNEDGTSIFDGFIDAAQNLWKKLDEYLGNAGGVISNIWDTLTGFFSKIKDGVGKIFGSLFTVASFGAIFYLVKKLIDVVELLYTPIKAALDLDFEALGKKIGKFIGSLTLKARAEAIKSIAIAIGVVAASMYLLSMIPEEKIGQAIVALVVAVGALAALAAVMTKMGDLKDTAKLATSILAISGSLVILALAAKMIGEMDNGVLLKAGGIIALILIVAKTMSKSLSGQTGGIVRFGKMMYALSGALIIMSIAISIFGHMKWETIIKGLVGATGCMGLLLGFLWAMTAIQKATDQTQIVKFGGTMLALSGALLILGSAILIFSRMKWSTMISGGAKVLACMALLSGFLLAITGIQKITDQNELVKFGGTMLALGGALILMAASIAILSLIKPDKLVVGLIAIGVLAGIMAALMYCSKFAVGIKMGPIIALSAAVGILAASLVALTFVDTKKLLGASAALGIVMGAFALMSTLGDTGLAAYNGVLVLTAFLAVLGAAAYVVIRNLPWVGEQLASFMTKAQPFFDGLEGIDASKTDAIGHLMEGLAKLTGISVLDRWTGGGSLTKIATEFVPFVTELAKGLQVLDDAMTDGNGKPNINVEYISSIIQCLSDLASIRMPVNFDVGVAAGKLTGLFGIGGYVNVKTENAKDFATKIDVLSDAFKTITSTLGSGDGKIKLTQKNIDLIKSVIECYDALSKISLPTQVEAALAGGGLGSIGPLLAFGAGCVTITPMDAQTFGSNISALASAFHVVTNELNSTSLEGGSQLAVTDKNIGTIESVIKCYEALSKIQLPTESKAGIAGGGLGVGPLFGLVGGYASVTPMDAQTFGSNISALASAFHIVANELTSTSLDGGSQIAVTDKNIGTIESVIKCYDALSKIQLPTETNSMVFGGGAAVLPALFGLVGGYSTVTTQSATEFTETINALSGAFNIIVNGITTPDGDFKFTDDDLTFINSVIESLSTLSKIELPEETRVNIAGLSAGLFNSIFSISIAPEDIESFGNKIKGLAGSLTTLNDDLHTDSGDPTIADVGYIHSVVQCLKDLSGIDMGQDYTVKLHDLFGNVIQIQPTDVEDFKTRIVGLAGALKGFSDGVTGENAINTESVTAASTALTKLTELCNAVPDASLVDKIIGTDEETFASNLEAIASGLVAFNTNVPKDFKNGETALAFIEKLLEFNGKIKEAGAQYYMTDFGEDVEGLGDALSLFYPSLTPLGEAIKGFNEALPTNFTGIDTAKSFVDKMLLLDTVLALRGGKFYLTDFGEDLEGLGDSIGEFWTQTDGLDGANLLNITTAISVLAGSMSTMETLTDAAGGIGKFKTALNELGTVKFDDFVNNIEETIKNADTKFYDAGKSIVDNIKDGLGAGSDTITTPVTAMVLTMLTNMRNKYLGFQNVGKYLVQGFAAGISANTFLAVAKASIMASAAITAAKAILLVNSPSKVFKEIGGSIPEGFAMGIDRFAYLAENSAVSMAESAIEDTRNALSRVASAITSDLDSQPTIRPVLDLSDIRAGASSIGGMFNMRPSVAAMANIGSVGAMMNYRQNGGNGDVVSAIKDLGRKIGSTPSTVNQIGNVTYDNDSSINNAVEAIVRAARIERRK